MTRDEVLEQAVLAVQAAARDLEDNYGVHSGYADTHTDAIRALKSKPPEKPPEVDAVSPQPPPRGNGTPILPLVLSDFQRRADAGLAKYGTPLRAQNGRAALVDAYQESQDQTLYLRQAIEDFDALTKRLAELQARDDSLLAQRDQEYVKAHAFASGVRAALGDPPATSDAEVVANVALVVKSGREMEFQLECPGTLVGMDLCGACRSCIIRERDSLKAQLKTEAGRRESAEAELRSAREHAERQDHRAAEAMARVKYLGRLTSGAPTKDEPTTPGADPSDGHPFAPMLGQPAICATCGYRQTETTHP